MAVVKHLIISVSKEPFNVFLHWLFCLHPILSTGKAASCIFTSCSRQSKMQSRVSLDWLSGSPASLQIMGWMERYPVIMGRQSATWCQSHIIMAIKGTGEPERQILSLAIVCRCTKMCTLLNTVGANGKHISQWVSLDIKLVTSYFGDLCLGSETGHLNAHLGWLVGSAFILKANLSSWNVQ